MSAQDWHDYWPLAVPLLLIGSVRLIQILFSKKKDKLDTIECMAEGRDEALMEMNELEQIMKSNKKRFFMIPSLFTDHRIFGNQTQIFKNILQPIDLFRLEENKDELLTLNSFAKQLAVYIVKNYGKEILNEDFESFHVGGFCVGGMISILLAQELMKTHKEVAQKLSGVLLIGSAPSFTHCVDPYYLNLKRIVMGYVPKFIFNSAIRLYLWSSKRLLGLSSWMERSVLTIWNADQNVMDEYKMTLKDMMHEKDPNFVIQMLHAEFNFTGHEDVEWPLFKNVPISHVSIFMVTLLSFSRFMEITTI